MSRLEKAGMPPHIVDKQKKADWLVSRLVRAENKINNLAEPYDELREYVGFLKAGIMDYLKTLEEENTSLQHRVDELEKNEAELKKENTALKKKQEPPSPPA